MVRAGCVFVAGIGPSRTWTSGSFESVRWNACVHRRDLGLYSHPKEFLGGMEFEPMLTPREKSPLPENVPRGGSSPQHCGQRAQALPTELFRPPEWWMICQYRESHSDRWCVAMVTGGRMWSPTVTGVLLWWRLEVCEVPQWQVMCCCGDSWRYVKSHSGRWCVAMVTAGGIWSPTVAGDVLLWWQHVGMWSPTVAGDVLLWWQVDGCEVPQWQVCCYGDGWRYVKSHSDRWCVAVVTAGGMWSPTVAGDVLLWWQLEGSEVPQWQVMCCYGDSMLVCEVPQWQVMCCYGDSMLVSGVPQWQVMCCCGDSWRYVKSHSDRWCVAMVTAGDVWSPTVTDDVLLWWQLEICEIPQWQVMCCYGDSWRRFRRATSVRTAPTWPSSCWRTPPTAPPLCTAETSSWPCSLPKWSCSMRTDTQAWGLSASSTGTLCR